MNGLNNRSCNNRLDPFLKHIVIVTDILPEAEALRDTLLAELFVFGSKCNVRVIDIASPEKREIYEVFEAPTPDTLRIFLFGTPRSIILKKQSDYRKIVDLPMQSIPTYVCLSSTPPAMSIPDKILPVWEFFGKLISSVAIIKTDKVVPAAFLRYAESRCQLPPIKDNFEDPFWESMEHCERPGCFRLKVEFSS